MQAVSDGSFRIVYVAKGDEGMCGSDFYSNLKNSRSHRENTQK